MKIGVAIKHLRKQNGMNQKTFAENVGITQSYLSQVEAGHKKLSMDLLENISDYLNVPLPVMLWFSVDVSDIKDDKLEAFKFLKPTIDSVINSII